VLESPSTCFEFDGTERVGVMDRNKAVSVHLALPAGDQLNVAMAFDEAITVSLS